MESLGMVSDKVIPNPRVVLRDYQVRGVEWLYSLYKEKSNGILADEMGLGKTTQVIHFLMKLKERRNNLGPHLIVMPLSVITSWRTDLQKFGMDMFDVYVHHEGKDNRHLAFAQWHHNLKCSVRSGLQRKVSLFLTTYEIAIKDDTILSKLSFGSVQWQYLVVDEAHRLKNKESLLFDVLNRVHSTGRRLLLTGTPLQNSLAELWSLLHFILPNKFNTEMDVQRAFQAEFEHDSDGDVEAPAEAVTSAQSMRGSDDGEDGGNAGKSGEKSEIVAQLHALLRPYILRRLKADVALELPTKVEKVVYCPLSALQREVYQQFRARAEESTVAKRNNPLYSALYDEYSSDVYGPYKKALTNVNNLLMQLRKLCNHPFLVLEDVQTIPDAMYYEQLLSGSGKMFVLDKLLTQLLSEGSKMTSMLDILQGYLQQRGVRTARLDGSTAHPDRERQLREFNRSRGRISNQTPINDTGAHMLSSQDMQDHANVSGTDLGEIALEEGDYSVFLLSTRAGGVGINLQAADTVILFDSDWNPQQDLQAISRAHRIGQTKPVLVLRLVSTGPDEKTYSVEQRILRRAAKKLEAERQVLAHGLFDLSERQESSHVNTRTISSTGAASSTAESTDSILSLFETITDTESVTSMDTPTAPALISMRLKQPIHLPNAALCVGSRQGLCSIVDMYSIDFSEAGIDRICCRSASEKPAISPNPHSKESRGSDSCEVLSFMDGVDLSAWAPWLYPEDIDRHLRPEESRNAAATTSATSPRGARKRSDIACASPDAHDGDVEEGAIRKGRRSAEKARLDYREDAQWKKLTSPFSKGSAKGKRKRGSRHRRSSCDYTSSSQDSDSSSEADSDCAASGDEDYNGRKNSPHRNRGGGSDGAMDASPRGKYPRRRKPPSASHLQHTLQEDDICAICGQAWVTAKELEVYIECKVQRHLEMDTEEEPRGDTLSTSATTGSDATLRDVLLCGGEQKSAPKRVTRSVSTKAADMLNMMLLCDGCDGSYHLICAGIEEVSEGEWYCRMCSQL